MLIRIAYLYPELMNIYGDRGNILCFLKRCQWRGLQTKVKKISLGDSFSSGDFDFYFAGGGQDKEQVLVSKDLQGKKVVLQKEAKRGVPMLLICGSYQLFGHYFKTFDGKKLAGISILDAYTVASSKRKIGNVIAQAEMPDINEPLVGFENHSGNTFIRENLETKPLGKVIQGFGNNGENKTEGAVYKNVIGTYLHGPILPKNPVLADCLIQKALEIRYQREIKLKPLGDELEKQARKALLNRFLPLKHKIFRGVKGTSPLR